MRCKPKSALAVLVATVGLAGAAAAQGREALPRLAAVPPGAPAAGPPWPGPLSDTARHNAPASPSCGAANPQGGTPSAVTWGDCP